MAAKRHESDSQKPETPRARRGKRRPLSGGMKWIVTAAALALACFHIGTAFFGVLAPMQQRSFHLAFVLGLIFLLYPARDGGPADRPTVLDCVLSLAGFVSAMYIFVIYEDLVMRMGAYEEYELYLGFTMLALIFEAARRVLGSILPVFCLLFLVYGYFGPYMPGPFLHGGLSIPRIIEEMYMTTDGIFGMVLGVSSTYIFMFVMFGAFLNATGAGAFFNDISMALTGHLRGGPAKIAVLSSALMGTISGSASANVATTGTFTIPLMKKVGYQPHFAGAVEAAASTGGQFMPPVLGAAAFIIADTVGVPYIKVVAASLVPALLYFFGIWCSLSVEANRLDLKGLDKASLPRASDVLMKTGYRALPLVAIITVLVMGRNPLFASCIGMVACLIVAVMNKEKKVTVGMLVDTLEEGAKGALSVAIACAIVGTVVGTMGLTGIALRIGDIIIQYTGGFLPLTLATTMIIALILGMGMPTSASYVMASAVAVPALVKMGCITLDAHFFCFFFAVLSSITPPVCISAYTAAGIAGAPPNLTAFTAIRLAIPGFLVPFIFIFSPELLLTNTTSWFTFAVALASGMVGIATLALGLEGYFQTRLRIVERVVLVGAALTLIVPGVITDAVGLALLGMVFCITRARRKSEQAALAAS